MNICGREQRFILADEVLFDLSVRGDDDPRGDQFK